MHNFGTRGFEGPFFLEPSGGLVWDGWVKTREIIMDLIFEHLRGARFGGLVR